MTSCVFAILTRAKRRCKDFAEPVLCLRADFGVTYSFIMFLQGPFAEGPPRPEPRVLRNPGSFSNFLICLRVHNCSNT